MSFTSFMQQQANAIAGPAQLAIPTPQPVTLRRGSLRWALDSMEDSVLTDSHRETTLKQFYNFNPTQMGQGLAHLNEMLVNHGNRGGTGPILLLFNTQNNLELAYAIAEVPLAMRDQLGRTAKHRTHPHIICFGHRTSDSQLPAALPIKLAEFFRSRRGKLADFQSASQADPATITAAPFVGPANAAVQQFVPVVPIIGKAWVSKVIDGIYGVDGSGIGPWRFQDLPIELSGYVNSVHDATTKTELSKSIMGLVTSKTARTKAQLGTFPTRPPPLPNQLEAFVLNQVNAVLDPSPAYQQPQALVQAHNTTQPSHQVGHNTLLAGNSSNNPGSSIGNPNMTNPAGNSSNNPGSSTGSPSMTSPAGNSSTTPGSSTGNPSMTNPAGNSSMVAGNSSTNPGSSAGNSSMTTTVGNSNNSAGNSSTNPGPPAGNNRQVSFNIPNQPPVQHQPGSSMPQDAHIPLGNPPRYGGMVPLLPDTAQQLRNQDYQDRFFLPPHAVPPSQLPRPNDTGINALPVQVKQKWMSFSRVQSLDALSTALKQFYDQPKSQRYSYWSYHVMPILRQRDPRAFNGFEFTAAFVERFADANLTSLDPSKPWWDGLTGSCLWRNVDEVGEMNQLLETRTDRNIHINVSQIGRLTSKAPTIPATMAELLEFLARLLALLELFVPLCSYNLILHRITAHMNMHNRVRNWANSPEYLRLKIPECILMLLRLERVEFNSIVPVEQLLDPTTEPDWFDPGDLETWVRDAVNPTRVCVEQDFPRGLVPRAAPTHPQSGHQRDTPPQPPNRRPQAPPTPQDRLPDGRRDTTPGNPAIPHINPQHHPSLRDFFASVPQQRQRDSLQRWLTAVQTSTNQCMTQLGLTGRDCGFYHIRGECRRPHCTRNHTPRELPQEAVTAVCTKLRQGLQATA